MYHHVATFTISLTHVAFLVMVVVCMWVCIYRESQVRKWNLKMKMLMTMLTCLVGIKRMLKPS